MVADEKKKLQVPPNGWTMQLVKATAAAGVRPMTRADSMRNCSCGEARTIL